MSFRPSLSHTRFTQYKQDLIAHNTEGSRNTAAAHSEIKRKANTRQRSFSDLFREFLGLIRGYHAAVILSLLTVTAATVLSLVPPYATKIVFDNVLNDDPLEGWWGAMLGGLEQRELLAVIGVGLIVITLIAAVIRLWGRWLNTRVTKRIQAKVRRQVFDHAVRLPLHRIQELKSGGVASILREDAGAVAELLFSMLYNPWRAIIKLIGTMTILAFLDWRLLVGSLVLVPTVFLTHRTWIARIRPLFRDIRHSRQLIDGHATEAFGGMRIVRGFGRQRTETNRFTRNNHFLIRQELQAWWWSRGVDTAWAILIPIASALLIWYGGNRVMDGVLTIGDLTAFLMYLLFLLEPLATLAGSATAFQNSLAALDRILDLMDEPPEVEPNPDAILLDPDQVNGRITIRNLSFAYPGTERLVLRDINLEVQPGEMIALVGPSGAGKTTLCNLIARFYTPPEDQSGESVGRPSRPSSNAVPAIELDGVDLRDFDLDSYRRLLGIVEQDIFLFDGTVAENIGYGRRGATLEEIEEAARLANAHEFITDLEQGYETLIGERGVKLSGGQRQRLAIARAILADPRILILDEATSSLDTESERLIQQSLDTLLRGRTSFVIAHRLSTITHADRILVMEGGAIIEEGTHDELMAESGKYRQMVELQTTPGPGREREPALATP